MTFHRPLFLLLLLLLPALWFRLRKIANISRVSLALKCLVFAVLVIALADPSAELLVQRLAITVLMDTSASMPRESIEMGQTRLRELVRKNSRAELHLITFAEHPHLKDLPNDASKVAISQSLDPNESMATDLENALQLALSTFPIQGSRRVLLISDGNENRGNVLAEVLRARERGVAVFSVPTGGTVRLPVALESVTAPQQVFAGERFTFSLRLGSIRQLSGRAWVTSEGQEIGSTRFELQPGSNPVDVEARATGDGVSLMQLHVSMENGAQQELFSQAVTVRRPHVLYIFSKDDGPSKPLLDTLKLAQVDVEMASAFPTAPVSQDWGAVLLDDYPDKAISPEEDAALSKYVFSGGGLIYIAGDKNSQLNQTPQTSFEELLPVQGDPPTSKEPTALMLVMDKSQSMYGPKIDMVRKAARASVATLRPIDKIGVITFDEVFQWVVPMGPNNNPARTSRLIDSIEADGATKIYPALQAAFEAIRAQKATRKHIILLTDGLSSPADFSQLLRDAASEHITISTIGVGTDVDRGFLQDIANITRGKFYFIDDPKRIEEIVSAEARELQMSAIEERPVRAVRVRPVEFTDGVDFDQAPRLLGFVREKAKTDAETILRVQSGEPLLVRWQYGLGRVIAFMSDARSRWSAPWVQWSSFGTLWPQMVRDVAHRDRTVRSGIRPGTREGESVVYYDVLKDSDTQAAAELPSSVQVIVSTPGQPSQTIPLEETAPGHYEARVSSDQYGLYRIVSGSDSLNLPEVGFYRQSEEMKPQEINFPLLGEISRATGGYVNPTTGQLLDEKGTYVREGQPLWPYWLVLALLLNFVEVAVRKGYHQSIVSWLRRAEVRQGRFRLSQ